MSGQLWCWCLRRRTVMADLLTHQQMHDTRLVQCPCTGIMVALKSALAERFTAVRLSCARSSLWLKPNYTESGEGGPCLTDAAPEAALREPLVLLPLRPGRSDNQT